MDTCGRRPRVSSVFCLQLFIVVVSVSPTLSTSVFFSSCAPNGTNVTCSLPAWSWLGSPISSCFNPSGDGTQCSLAGVCSVWCSMAGYGPCIDAVTSAGSTTYADGTSSWSPTRVTSVTCVQSPTLRLASYYSSPALSDSRTFSAVCHRNTSNTRFVSCVDVKWAKNSILVDRCAISFCDTQTAALVCALLGFGSLQSLTVRVVSQTMQAGGRICTPPCGAFDVLTCQDVLPLSSTISISATVSVGNFSKSYSRTRTPSRTQTRTSSLTRQLHPTSSLTAPPLITVSAALTASLDAPSRTRSFLLTPSPPKVTQSATATPTSPRNVALKTSVAAGLSAPLPLRRLVGSDAALAVLVTAFGGSAIAGAVSPTAPNKVSSTARLLQAGACEQLLDEPSPPVPFGWNVLDEWTVAQSTLLFVSFGAVVLTLSTCTARVR